MIDLNKKYRTGSGGEVLLHEIVGDQVFGRFRQGPNDWWLPASWWKITGDYIVTCVCTSEQRALVRKRRSLVEVKPFEIDGPGLYEDKAGRRVMVTNVGVSASAGVMMPAGIADSVMCWYNEGHPVCSPSVSAVYPLAPLVKKLASFDVPELS